jgi:hypothetical protein
MCRDIENRPLNIFRIPVLELEVEEEPPLPVV